VKNLVCLTCGHVAPVSNFPANSSGITYCPKCESQEVRVLEEQEKILRGLSRGNPPAAKEPLPSCPHCNCCVVGIRQITVHESQSACPPEGFTRFAIACGLCGVQGPIGDSDDSARALWTQWVGRLAPAAPKVRAPLLWKPVECSYEELEEPLADPIAMARHYIQSMGDDDCSDLWGARYLLQRDGMVTIALEACELTTDLLPEEEQFDGYVAGEEWYRLTGETCKVKVSLSFEVLT